MSALPLDAIEVGERDRVDLGDVAALAASIAAVGLLHPVVVTATEGGHALVAGGRRLAAVRSLGWPEVPVTVVTLDTVEDALRAEWDENAQRKALAPWESEAGAARREVRMRKLAKGNQGHGQTGPGRNAGANLAQASSVTDRKARSLSAVGSGYGPSTLAKVAEVRHVVEDDEVTVAGRTVTVTPEVREVAVAAAEQLRQPGAKVDAAHRQVREALENHLLDDPGVRLAMWHKRFIAEIDRVRRLVAWPAEDIAANADARARAMYDALIADLVAQHTRTTAPAPADATVTQMRSAR